MMDTIKRFEMRVTQMGNDSFHEQPTWELARILRNVADKIEAQSFTGLWQDS